MFLKVLFGVYLISAVVGILLFFTATAECSHKWKEKHPDFVSRKPHWFNWVSNFVRIAFTFFCPVFNTFIAAFLLFAYSEYCEELMKRMEEMYAQRPEENQEVL